MFQNGVMRLEELQEHWNVLARTDPLGAILTTPHKKNGQWRPDEFFETGKEEIGALMKSVAAWK
jgi:hypothetical protein